MNIPKYRIKEILLLYEIFCDEEFEITKNIDLIYRKDKFKNIIKSKYKWIDEKEFKEIYKLIKNKELETFLNKKKIDVSYQYKDKLVKLFCNYDGNDDLLLDLDEFKLIIIKFNIFDINNIENLFKEVDLDGNGSIDIEEFITFISKNDTLLEKMDQILDSKFELKKKLDKRSLLFNNFPGSPLKHNWRPSLHNLNSLEFIKNKYNKISDLNNKNQ